jgi:hypothetical protein
MLKEMTTFKVNAVLRMGSVLAEWVYFFFLFFRYLKMQQNAVGQYIDTFLGQLTVQAVQAL